MSSSFARAWKSTVEDEVVTCWVAVVTSPLLIAIGCVLLPCVPCMAFANHYIDARRTPVVPLDEAPQMSMIVRD